MSGEFELIDRMVDLLGETARDTDVRVGPGDDAAVLRAPPGHELVVSTDTLVAGRHYPPDARAELIGYRGLAVAVSDLAAMGAEPRWATVALVVPELDEEWAARFASGVRRAALACDIKVVGGNLARGPSCVSVTAQGSVPAGAALLRGGAKPGDGVYVTGSLGGATLALADPALAAWQRESGKGCDAAQRYWEPAPRLDVGVGLRGLASAAIDVSDGLAADLTHLCRASGVCGEVDLARVPTFPGAEATQAIGASDDYELAFSAPPANAAALQALERRTRTQITRIGRIRAGAPPDVRWLRDGARVRPPAGFRHF